MASSNGPPLSLRPFPVADKKPKNLAEFIARVNAQPGGFRATTEEKLREDVKSQAEGGDNGVLDDQDVDMSDDDDGDEEVEDAADKDPNAVRLEVLKDIDAAGNAAMLTLDSLSLLLSKQNPTQAGATLSQHLRDMVGIGTLGADKLDDNNVTEAKVKDGETVAVGWTLLDINKTRDSAEQASAFLRREIEAEGRYWEDVMSVHKHGWSICKMPQERHTLGVRFGFSEATQEFKSHGLAALRRGDGGSVQLDCGRFGGVSERLVVSYKRNGKVVGRSSLPAPTDDDAPLEDRVLEARNAVFSQELWHELSREARTLVAHNVRSTGSQLTYAAEPGTEIAFELVPLESGQSQGDSVLENSSSENNMAETISLTLHILLSYAHRYNELLRTRPLPPHIQRSRGQQQSYALLRPIIARLLSIRNTKACTQYIGALVASLKSAGLPASFTLQTPQTSPSNPAPRGPNQPSGPQNLIRNMLQPLEFLLQINILPDISFTVRGRTFLFPVTATYYHILLPPSSPLQRICAPYKDGYPDTRSLVDYLRTATAHLLTDHFLAKLKDRSRKLEWIPGIKGMSICVVEQEDFELRFDVEEDEALQPALVVTCDSVSEGKGQTTSSTWPPSEPGEAKLLEEVVDEAVTQILESDT